MAFPEIAATLGGGLLSGLGGLFGDETPPNKAFQMQGTALSRRPMVPQQRKVFRQLGSLISGLLEMGIGGGNPLEQINEFRSQRRQLPSRFLSQPSGNYSAIVESIKQALPGLQQSIAAKAAKIG